MVVRVPNRSLRGLTDPRKVGSSIWNDCPVASLTGQVVFPPSDPVCRRPRHPATQRAPPERPGRGRRSAARTIPVLLLTDREAVEDRDAGAVVTREMLGREVWRDPGCHLTNVIDLDREGTPMNGQHPLTRREALRAASAFGAGGAALALA